MPFVQFTLEYNVVTYLLAQISPAAAKAKTHRFPHLCKQAIFIKFPSG